ncbi:DUF1963 domain-containing protein [Rhizobium oryziradicis]|uniref:DUF1963 domain-containing protein n=1 Tax=Rhizobium oryziradicis TaxID=1867956 RepID=A0A1Q8ZSG1_9HYPH|nr:DUF1963 domain-containing protein [Rhizobium oryziradicis]OLP45013.1 hypothetical protein BJF95_05410 [Rhizobium oryziradicis]
MDVFPFPGSREALLSALKKSGLSDEIQRLLAAQARPAILLTTSGCDEEALPLGATKIGGRPDLPADKAWPRRPPYPDAEKRAAAHRREADRLLEDSRKPKSWMTLEQGDRFSQERRDNADAVEREFPLAFLGQFDLSDLSTLVGFDPAFPDHGRLLVFYDYLEQPEDFTEAASVGWRVLWDDTPDAELIRAPIPPELFAISDEKWSCVFTAARATSHTIWTPIPPSDSSWSAFPLDDEDALEAYQEWLSDFGTPDMADRDNHQLCGFPQPLQNGLQATSQLVANGIDCGRREAWQSEEAVRLLADAKDWRLVAQIGVDPNAGLNGPGAYYVMMRDEDIRAQRFERARVIYQCD